MTSNPTTPDTITVAFASTDDETVNQHFGSARRFRVCGLAVDGSHRVEGSKEFKPEKQDGNEDKLVGKIAWLREAGVDIVVVAQVGPSAARQLMAAGTQPFPVADKPAIADVLTQLGNDLTEGNSPWLARLVKKKFASASRIDAMLEDDWDE